LKTPKEFTALVTAAHAAGLAAAAATTPEPMVLGDATITYIIPGGVCGFAGVRIRPATSSFARWMKKTGLARSSYYGGLETSVREFGQSMGLKMAYARAYADTLSAAGIDAYAWDRID